MNSNLIKRISINTLQTKILKLLNISNKLITYKITKTYINLIKMRNRINSRQNNSQKDK
jgi:hypothetical protein